MPAPSAPSDPLKGAAYLDFATTDGSPVSGKVVEAKLVHANRWTGPFLLNGLTGIARTQTATTNSDGRAVLELYGNDQITPAGSVWQITELESRVSKLISLDAGEVLDVTAAVAADIPVGIGAPPTGNFVVTTGSYANPTWITSLAWGKITGTPTTLAGYGITDGGGGAWGSITGTLSNQTDLQSALDAKQAASSTLTTLSSATSAGLALMDDDDASAQRTTLGLGALATVTPGTGVATALAIAPNATGGFLTTIATGKRLWVDSVNGNDSNAGTLDKTKLTLGGAKSAASSGDLIMASPGSYSTTASIAKDGVSLSLPAGATVTKSGGDDIAVFSDGASGAGSAMTSLLNGEARLVYVTASGDGYTGGIGINDASSVLTANVRSISSSGSEGFPTGVSSTAGTGYVRVLESITATNSAGYGYGVYWEQGNLHVAAPRITGNGSAIWAAAGTANGDLFLSADDLQSSASGIAAIKVSSSDAAAEWITASTIRGNANTPAIYHSGADKLYVTAQKIFSQIASDNTGLGYYTFQKLEAQGIGLVALYSGEHRLNWPQFNPNGDTTAAPMEFSSSGTNYVNGGDYVGGATINGITIGSGINYLMNMVIDLSANSSTDAITVSSGATLYLINCKVKSDSGKKDINNSGGGTVYIAGGSGSGTGGAFTTSGAVNFLNAESSTGTGNFVRATSPTITTPTIGAISGLSTLTGTTGDMTITAGTGNSRVLNLRATTSGGAASDVVIKSALATTTAAAYLYAGGFFFSGQATSTSGIFISGGNTVIRGGGVDVSFGASSTAFPAAITVSGTTTLGGGTAIAKSATYTAAMSASISAGSYSTVTVTATGVAAGDTFAVEIPLQSGGIVLAGVRGGTDQILVDFYNADLLSAHSLTGTVKIRSFEV